MDFCVSMDDSLWDNLHALGLCERIHRTASYFATAYCDEESREQASEMVDDIRSVAAHILYSLAARCVTPVRHIGDQSTDTTKSTQ